MDELVERAVQGWTDSHCHLGDDAEELVAEALAAGVIRLVDVGTTLADSRLALERARRFAPVFATAGVHPHDAKDGIDGLTEMLVADEVVAVGECGLDYHYDHSSREAQRGVRRPDPAGPPGRQTGGHPHPGSMGRHD